jgi:hypothetical protein
MAITIRYGTHGAETQKEAMERWWAPSVRYAEKLFRDKAERDKIKDKAGIGP